MSLTNPSDDVDVADRWDQAFRVLSQEPRRQLLISLTDKPASVWVQLPDAALSSHYQGTQDDLRIALYHQHLPLLAEHGYVVWEESPFEARQGPKFKEVEAIIRAVMAFGDGLPDKLITNCRVLENQINET